MPISTRTSALLVSLLAFDAAWVTAVEAAPITLSQCYTGECEALTGSVEITVTDDVLDENDGAGDLKLVIHNLTNGFVDEIGLSYHDGLAANSAIEQFTASHSAGAPTLTFTECQNDNSGQSLNVCFDFQNSTSTRLKAGQSVTLFLDSATAPLWSTSLIDTAAYAHIQGLPEGGSVKIVPESFFSITGVEAVSIPEPATMLLLAGGFSAIAIRERRRRLLKGARAHSEANTAQHPE